MTPQSFRAVLVAAGACLGLSACGGGSVTAVSEPAAIPASTIGPMKLTGHFCHDADVIMREQPSDPAGQKVTVADARAELAKILRLAAAGYTALEPEAPSTLRGPIRTIISVYTADEHHLASYGSITQMGASIVRSNTTGAGRAAIRQVLAYMAKNCG
jgi:hypothetical protein